MNKQEAFMIRIDEDKHAYLKQLSEVSNHKLVEIGRHAVDALILYAKNQGIDNVAFPLLYPKQIREQQEEISKLQNRITQLEKLVTTISTTHHGAAAEQPEPYNVIDPEAEAENTRNANSSNQDTGTN